jgi:hypothetical protein
MGGDGGQRRMSDPGPASQPATPASTPVSSTSPLGPHAPAAPAVVAGAPPVAAPATAGGSVYAGLIAQQLVDEQARKASLEQRGLAVITTSGVLVSLLFGLGAVVLKRAETLGLPLAARLLLVAALAAFVAAAGLGLATNLPRTYTVVALADLRRMVTPGLWDRAERPAARRVAENRVELLAVARQLNGTKAQLLQWAVGAETTGVALVAAAVAVLLLQGH